MTCAGYVYIMAGRRNGTIYTGVTSDLVRRVTQHRTGEIKGFTAKYGCKLLVWYEAHDDLQNARQRELRIIEEVNPDWNDLFESICQNWTPAFAGEQGSEASP
ncbi:MULTISPECIES: GIY-YIG nuclease family protein [unclassified Sphingobium]|uniref:GIY-YIG nuclease family protein n=1 Tax=unclassified Sphingobium TaxID=2611147 RepID=UPI0022252FAA|nr:MULTISPECIES: GIY-YIG nuclease family protein [unclassified Sphingobium]MCW2348704.1 putative endonuclease [Sphingobium sp. B12D2B]MCW2383464.1 putative endonuclease [Sphingobium sp. B2D3B]MCW2399561.1 putative endonuclease [Sphingobium sp. B2D3C]